MALFYLPAAAGGPGVLRLVEASLRFPPPSPHGLPLVCFCVSSSSSYKDPVPLGMHPTPV